MTSYVDSDHTHDPVTIIFITGILFKINFFDYQMDIQKSEDSGNINVWLRVGGI
jgi:hypothetical protein